VREIEIPLALNADYRDVQQAIERAIGGCGLRVSLRCSLEKFPGCIHWHLKKGSEPGTLEITLWPKERRAWFTIQNGRRADWIEGKLNAFRKAIGG
jgi:hypothetical protein